MIYRAPTAEDFALLAEMNHQLISDEGHRNPMTVAQLEERMRGWLDSGEYAARIFQEEGAIAGYALYRESTEEIHLRQLFIVRERRRRGLGRKAMKILMEEVWPGNKRWTLEALSGNAAAIAFYRSIGFRDYSIALEFMPPAGNHCAS